MNTSYYQGLPDTLYLCRVPILATYSEEEAAIYGMPIDSTNGKYNPDTFTEMTNVMINIDRMVNLYTMGYPINIINYEDSKEVFESLDKYLNIQVNKIQSSINQPLQEDSRLSEMDKFLTEMFDFNRETIVGGMITNGGGFDLGLGLMNGGNGVTNVPVSLNGSKPSINDAYNNTNNIYIQPNQVMINMNDVTREKVVKTKTSSINAAFLNKSNKEIT